VEDQDKNTEQGLLQAKKLESNVDFVALVSSNADGTKASVSKLANESNDDKVAIAPKTEMFPENNEEKTFISVTHSEEVGKVKQIGKLMDFSIFKIPSYTIVVMSLMLMCLGHYTPPLHLVSYIQYLIIGVIRKLKQTTTTTATRTSPNKRFNEQNNSFARAF